MNEAFAASTDIQRNPAVGAGIWVVLAIVYLSRRRPIGGWLLYFYVQLYLGFAVSLIFLPQVFSNLNPSNWNNSLQYVMFFLSVVPVLVAQLTELYGATQLLFRKNESNVKFLRNTLIALCASSAVAIVIDLNYFKDDPGLFFDFLTLFFSAIWIWYFSKARRVKLVFIEKKWVYSPHSERRVLTIEDKRKLRKRAAIAALVTFVLFLLLIGSEPKNEGKQLDFGIFFVPLFYALIAAVVAWYLPLRKRKSSTENTETEPAVK